VPLLSVQCIGSHCIMYWISLYYVFSILCAIGSRGECLEASSSAKEILLQMKVLVDGKKKTPLPIVIDPWKQNS
jgi:hypothetical protein